MRLKSLISKFNNVVDTNPDTIMEWLTFKYIEDALSKEEAYNILINSQKSKENRIQKILNEGYPSYTTTERAGARYLNAVHPESVMQERSDGVTAAETEKKTRIQESLRLRRGRIKRNNPMVRTNKIKRQVSPVRFP